MSLVKQGQVMTTRGLRERKPAICNTCREAKGGLYVRDPNGGFVCGDCAGSVAEGVIRQECNDPDSCACGQANQTEGEAVSD